MADLTGTHMSQFPIISQNTASILRHKAVYYSGTGSVSIPLVKGTRYIIYAILTSGTSIQIGFSLSAGLIDDLRFSYSQAAGPMDLSNFFRSAPFTQYEEPSDTLRYLVLKGSAAASIIATVVHFNG